MTMHSVPHEFYLGTEVEKIRYNLPDPQKKI